MTNKLKAELSANSLERLRWYVCKYLGVFPYGEMRDSDIIKCGIHMLIDKKQKGVEHSNSSTFDEDRFSRLKGGARYGDDN